MAMIDIDRNVVFKCSCRASGRIFARRDKFRHFNYAGLIRNITYFPTRLTMNIAICDCVNAVCIIKYV